jgi:hypothetical protein
VNRSRRRVLPAGSQADLIRFTDDDRQVLREAATILYLGTDGVRAEYRDHVAAFRERLEGLVERPAAADDLRLQPEFGDADRGTNSGCPSS